MFCVLCCYVHHMICQMVWIRRIRHPLARAPSGCGPAPRRARDRGRHIQQLCKQQLPEKLCPKQPLAQIQQISFSPLQEMPENHRIPRDLQAARWNVFVVLLPLGCTVWSSCRRAQKCAPHVSVQECALCAATRVKSVHGGMSGGVQRWVWQLMIFCPG